MQRQRSPMGSLPDTVSFDCSPTIADENIEQPVFWSNDVQNYAHNAIPEYITSSTNGGNPYLNSSSQAQNLSGWNRGESSSSGTQNYAINSEQKIKDGPSNVVPVRGVNLNQTRSTYSPLFMQSARNNPFPQDLNMGIEIGEINGNNRELVEGPPSGCGGYFGEEAHSSEDRRLSGNKRKVMEGHIGQSSSRGSSSYFRQVDEWNNTPRWDNARFCSNSSSASLENHPYANPSEAPSVEPSRRRRRVRISSSPQQSPSPTMLPSGNVYGDSSILRSPQTSLLVPRAPQSSNLPAGSSSQAAPASGFFDDHMEYLSRLRSALLMGRQPDTAITGASSSRSAASWSEVRRQLLSEIRHVLDLMQRGERLRMGQLDQSVLSGRADIHDQHRDVRIDVDNMSYEDLSALEERIGNVSTGLSEETIMDRLKQRKFFSICCICREDYNDGEDIGTIECGHEFHSGCIKQWLVLKNSCPICKATALNK